MNQVSGWSMTESSTCISVDRLGTASATVWLRFVANRVIFHDIRPEGHTNEDCESDPQGPTVSARMYDNDLDPCPAVNTIRAG